MQDAKHEPSDGMSRRDLHTLVLAAAAASLAAPAASTAEGLTVQDVTPAVLPPTVLTEREKAIVEIFERATYSVVNVFDLSLQVRRCCSAGRGRAPALLAPALARGRRC